MPTGHVGLTLGPVLFNWPAEQWSDFYARIADEAELDRVVLGEVVCSKRLPLYADRVAPAIERLQRAGKTVALASLGLVTTERERRLSADLTDAGLEVEVNDLSLLAMLPPGRRFSVGPLVNVYNEATLAFLAESGARTICLPPELPLRSVEILARAGETHGVAVEVWSFGRVPLALSGRCYHARVQGLSKDSCQFVCGRDADGLAVTTRDGEGFLAVNGVQTLSHACATTLAEIDLLSAAGVASLRLSPHSGDMVTVTQIFRDRLRGRTDSREAQERLRQVQGFAPFCNGFLHGRAGAALVGAEP